jgi:protein tyrosine/serine phosphatase
MLKLAGWIWKVSSIIMLVLSGVVVLTWKIDTGTSEVDSIEGKRYGLIRPTEWAIPIEKEGLTNFHKISEDLYRGAQPTATGVVQLKKIEIKTIMNLRSFHSDRDEIGNLDIGYEHIYMKAWHPEEKEIIKFLKIVTDQTKTPVFVHCQHGADRTGLMCAIYRVAICGWSKEAAAEEMISGGYGFHSVWKNLINYFMNLDIEKIKKEALSEKIKME